MRRIQPKSQSEAVTRLRRVASVLAVLLLVGAVTPFVVYAAPQVIGGEESYVVLTGSMRPAIQPGDVVIVGEVPPEQVREGDVITFYRRDTSVPVTHRVVEVDTSSSLRYFVTKGDANEDADSAPVAANRVVGKVLLTIPLIGYVVEFANSQYGFVAFIVVPFGLLFASEMWSLWRSTRGEVGDEGGDSDASEDAPITAIVRVAGAESTAGDDRSVAVDGGAEGTER